MPSAAQCSLESQPPHTPDDFLACAGLPNPGDKNDALFTSLLLGSGAPPASDIRHGWVIIVGISMMRLNRMIFGANNYTGSNPTEDCAQVDVGQGLNAGQLALSSASQALGLTATGIQAATGSSLGAVSAAGGLLGGVASAIPIAGAIISVFTSIWSLFEINAHRVQAEKDLLCNISGTYNAMAEQIETTLKNGDLTADQATQLLANVGGQLINRMRGFVAYKYGDAEWGYSIILTALVAYNAKVVYPSLSTGIAGLSKNTLLYLGGGLVLAKLLGVF
jgi:hypothetical protein